MKNEKTIEISVKTLFTGKISQEQAFVDLIRRRSGRNGVKSTTEFALIPKLMYNRDTVVFPGVHAPERGKCYE
jgi:hypothetical protein